MTCGNEYNDKEIRSTQTLTGHGLLTLMQRMARSDNQFLTIVYTLSYVISVRRPLVNTVMNLQVP